ncbi:MAG TPA: 3-ketoacyl-ACP reductase FabG2 [Gammaproteobacteria bacterium]|nr:3-ketoacyl-ACP reductase FabG2 [Gammaproteobacteria bacterium]
MKNPRTALITGSSRGIGKAVALQLANDGFNIVLHCHSNLDAASEVKAQIESMGVQSRILQFDIADRTQARQAIDADIERHGAYYGIVCNAGIARDNAFPSLSDADWDLVLHTNLDGFYNVLHPAIMPMVQARMGGRIVAMTSVSGIMGNRGQVNYSASKAGIIGAAKALAIELAKRAITVNCVAPGLIETDMIAEAPLEEALKLIPARRLGKAEEVAALVAYLFSDKAAYVTRQVISINGGMC